MKKSDRYFFFGFYVLYCAYCGLKYLRVYFSKVELIMRISSFRFFPQYAKSNQSLPWFYDFLNQKWKFLGNGNFEAIWMNDLKLKNYPDTFL